MKIQIASDLHLEMRRPQPYPPIGDFSPVAGRDVLVLAGDIGVDLGAWPFIERELNRSPVIYVPGNHEYYSWQTHEDTDEAWRCKARDCADLHYLTGEAISLHGVRFWGGPWFSDFFGRQDRRYAHAIANGVNDFSERFDDFGRWTVARHVEEHARQTRLLLEHAGRLDVVVTHWPPTVHAIAPRFHGNHFNGYFVNDREDLVKEVGAQCWISGHVHDAYEARVGETRVIGNPAGYPNEAPAHRLFRPDRVIEVSPGE